jgi:hypothetical protein
MLASSAFLTGTPASAAVLAPPTSEEPDPQPRVVLPDESGYSPSLQDGGGSVTVSPATVPVSSPVSLTFVYTAGEKGIEIGGGVLCNVSNFWGWTPPQNRRPDAPGYVTVSTSAKGIELGVEVDSVSQAVVARIGGRPLRSGERITFVYGDTSNDKYPSARGTSDRYAERDERFFFKVDGDGDTWFAPVEQQPRFRVEAKDAVRLVTYAPSRADAGQPFELTVAALDGTDNLVESYQGTVCLLAQGAAAEHLEQVQLSNAERGAVTVRVTPTAPGPLRMIAADAADALQPAISNPCIVSEKPDATYTLYWADLQGHSNVCDGTAAPQDYYRYARDVARLDAVALTTHDHWGYSPLDEDDTTWQRLCETCRRFNEPGRFVTIPGYEWTNWTFGHMHVLFARESEAKVFGWADENSDHPQELWRLLAGRDCLTIPHHPGGHPIPTCWKYYDPKFQPVVEIAAVHGVSEQVGHPRSISGPEKPGMVQSALARGYRLGLIGSGDTHDGHPGIGSPGARAGLAGIYATELTRAAIFEALRARRVYATTGCRAILRFHLDKHPMGSVVRLTGPEARRTFSTTILGDAPVAALAIVKNNREVASRAGESLITSWEWTDPAPAKDGDYYYARIVQADGEWIWSSPIFIELPTASN